MTHQMGPPPDVLQNQAVELIVDALLDARKAMSRSSPPVVVALRDVLKKMFETPGTPTAAMGIPDADPIGTWRAPSGPGTWAPLPATENPHTTGNLAGSTLAGQITRRHLRMLTKGAIGYAWRAFWSTPTRHVVDAVNAHVFQVNRLASALGALGIAYDVRPLIRIQGIVHQSAPQPAPAAEKPESLRFQTGWVWGPPPGARSATPAVGQGSKPSGPAAASTPTGQKVALQATGYAIPAGPPQWKLSGESSK